MCMVVTPATGVCHQVLVSVYLEHGEMLWQRLYKHMDTVFRDAWPEVVSGIG